MFWCSQCARIGSAQTAYPMLMSVRPVAVQAGAEAEVTISSRYTMAGAYQVLVSGEGVTGQVVLPETKPEDEKKPVDKLKIKLAAASDALPGVRDVRIATPQGISTVGQLVVVRDPVVSEAGSNDTPAQAQLIELPAAVCGAIEKNEDVDYYKFHAEAGEAIVFQVHCARLQDRIHDLQTHTDPILTLRSAAGATLAASDNNDYYADPLLAYRFQEAGEYLLEVRDVRYQGNQYWEYCIESSSRPLVESDYPLAVSAGTGLPLSKEKTEDNDTPEKAESIAVPIGVNGRIEREGDVDCFAFEVKQGDAISLEVIARRARSSLDSQLRIVDAKGKQLVFNDDLRLGKRGHSDSWIENWVAPADGTYVAELRDVHMRGGPQYPYFLKITRSEPYFELYLDADKSQICPGGCAALFVRMERKNGFTGEVQLAIDGLPQGVSASCGRILADKGQDGCIVLEAEPDASLAAANVVVTGTAMLPPGPDGNCRTLFAVATPYQEIYQPGGGRGHWPVSTHTLAVTDPADIRGLTLSTYDIVLAPGESKRIEVTIDRSPGFTANVTLDMLMRHLNTTYANTLPTGVTLNDKDARSLLAGSDTQGYLTLVAAKDAPPVERQQAVVMAHVALNFVMKWTYASRPVSITVVKRAE